ncbi:hypothetical protein [Christiangramia sp. SM2212]|uniref:Lipoprotein n=1 Tax=Christiangramia sediminicola TaxID=3073267 RepID=A0ABU1ET54_9FLAO|nr:hypothetical protein [Christiangramia sp. SM2212]MDR5591580.1 hypothetical protein [Christiangramia sp. SM2212]
MERLVVLLIIVVAGCSPKIKSNLTNAQPALSANDEVAFLDLKHEVPQKVVKIGSLKFQDSGFSTDCSFNSILNKARLEARKNGANIVKVVEKKEPDLWSSCYRLNIDLYKFEGSVSSLPQYKLTLD